MRVLERQLFSPELHGFGLPTSRLLERAQFDAAPVPTLHYRIEQLGWFTDMDGQACVRVRVGGLGQIVVWVEHGNIKITDATLMA